MTRVEGSMATPDPLLNTTTKVAPRPADRKGHPTFVVTQFAPVSPSFTSQQRDNAFEQRLWSLVAPSFRPQTIQPQRPTAADTVTCKHICHIENTVRVGQMVKQKTLILEAFLVDAIEGPHD